MTKKAFIGASLVSEGSDSIIIIMAGNMKASRCARQVAESYILIHGGGGAEAETERDVKSV